MPPVWKKFISPEDEALWESRMEVQAEGRFAITSVAGRQRLKVDVFLDEGEDDDGSGFVQAFGGSVVALADEDWQSVQVRPILVKVRDRLVITSTTEPEAQARLRKTYPGRKLIIIPAELAFGTGEHETTATCLRFLVDVAKERDSWSLLDLGTGTGILAIAAKLLGASQVLGWENDPLAVPVADRNVLTHGLAQDAVKIEAEDVLAWEPHLRRPPFEKPISALLQLGDRSIDIRAPKASREQCGPQFAFTRNQCTRTISKRLRIKAEHRAEEPAIHRPKKRLQQGVRQHISIGIQQRVCVSLLSLKE
jgi:ribosomal protein L11 methyltransferase